MKSILVFLCAAAGFTLACRAEDASSTSSFYTKLDLGAAFQGDVEVNEFLGLGPLVPQPKLDTDTGFRLGVVGGYKLSTSFAAELESGFVYNAVNAVGDIPVPFDFNIYQVPVLANLVYTVPLEGKIKPYVGAGVGGVLMIADADGETENEFPFAWQVQAGVDYQISNSCKAGLGYKLMGTGEVNWSIMKADSFLTHSVSASVTFTF